MMSFDASGGRGVVSVAGYGEGRLGIRARARSYCKRFRAYEDNVLDILMENLERLWRGEKTLRNQVI